MLLRCLESPVSIFSLDDIGIDKEVFLEKTASLYSKFDWDEYLLRQNQIEFIRKYTGRKVSSEEWFDYYLGRASLCDSDLILKCLTEEQFSEFSKIVPTRRRAMSEFVLEYCNGWSVKRVEAQGFGQKHAMIFDENNIDYRLAERYFSELPEEAVDDNLMGIIKFFAFKISKKHFHVKKIRVIVHHTQILTFPETSATNSPEGIHQDGMDYIISALAVEVKNFTGGKSVIYGSDKQTPLVEVNLKPGQGVFQPDRGTDLWHTVTPILSKDGVNPGYRSTVGFDFELRG